MSWLCVPIFKPLIISYLCMYLSTFCKMLVSKDAHVLFWLPWFFFFPSGLYCFCLCYVLYVYVYTYFTRSPACICRQSSEASDSSHCFLEVSLILTRTSSWSFYKAPVQCDLKIKGILHLFHDFHTSGNPLDNFWSSKIRFYTQIFGAAYFGFIFSSFYSIFLVLPIAASDIFNFKYIKL